MDHYVQVTYAINVSSVSIADGFQRLFGTTSCSGLNAQRLCSYVTLEIITNLHFVLQNAPLINARFACTWLWQMCTYLEENIYSYKGLCREQSPPGIIPGETNYTENIPLVYFFHSATFLLHFLTSRNLRVLRNKSKSKRFFTLVCFVQFNSDVIYNFQINIKIAHILSIKIN